MEKNFFFLCQKFTYSVTWTLGGFRSLDESTSTLKTWAAVAAAAAQ